MKFRLTSRGIVFTALMAAMIFVATSFIRIEIPTPTGPTNLKTGNILCLLSGLLFGGWAGGLASGIGSMLFDLTNPVYASSAPFTLVFFFLMGAICGLVSHARGRNGQHLSTNILGAALGAISYFVLYISKSIITLVLAGSALWPAVVATVPKMITSGTNVVIAVVCSVLIALPARKALERAHLLDTLSK